MSVVCSRYAIYLILADYLISHTYVVFYTPLQLLDHLLLFQFNIGSCKIPNSRWIYATHILLMNE